MSWEDDWKRWSHATYGIIQAISIADRLDGGNLTNLWMTIGDSSDWSKSAVGFSSSAARQQMRPNSIEVDPAAPADLLHAVRASISAVLLIGTVSITETLLSELLVTRGMVENPPANLNEALRSVEKHLRDVGELERHGWAIDALHEVRVLRNVLVHAAGIWSKRAVDDFAKTLPKKIPPVAGTAVSVNTDDLFAYRRAARTLINATARLKVTFDGKRG